MTTNQLLAQKGLAITDLLNAWEQQLAAGQTLKVQSGLIIGFVEAFDAYVINGFYPAMAERFHHAENRMHYFVVEFDSADCSWESFRKEILGVTNSSKASSTSLRGQCMQIFQSYLGAIILFMGVQDCQRVLLNGWCMKMRLISYQPDWRYLQRRGVSAATRAWSARKPIVELAALSI